MLFESFSVEDTMKIAYDIAQKAQKGEVYCLFGDLGVGKTAFTKGFAKGINIDSDVTSPTFTIINEYTDGRLPLYHFDVYRITDESAMEDVGYEDYFYGDGVCLVEWAELISGIIPNSCYEIRISKNLDNGVDYRQISVSKRGVK